MQFEATMVIKREDLDKIDFSDISTGELIPLSHPGDMLRKLFLEPLSMSANALATALHVPAPRINDVVLGKRAISADTALRLSQYFGTTPQFWMNLQSDYALRIAARLSGDQIKSEITPRKKTKQTKSPKPPRTQPRAAALASGAAVKRTIAVKPPRKKP
jgi:addiction module HigA family antidote